MKIREVKVYIVSQDLGEKSFCYSQAWYNSRTIMLVEILTEDGLSGFGEAFGNAYINSVIVEKVYKPRLIGRNVFESGSIWDDLYNILRDCGQKGSCVQALSAIDNALWDLKGKYVHLPVYTLLGGARREKIIPYATGLYHSISPRLEKELAEEAVSYVDAGFQAIKMKVGFGVEKDIQLVKRIRSEIGSKIKLMIDANHAYNALSAIKLAKGVEEYDITWFEEPVPPEDYAGYCEVKREVSIPIAGGEAEFTAYGFRSFVQQRCADIVQPDCSSTGGLSEFMKIMVMAKLENIQCYPNVWGSAVAVSVGINAAFAMPDFPESLNPAAVYLELDRTPNIFREELSMNSLHIDNGYLIRHEHEGLGLAIDRKLIERYQINN